MFILALFGALVFLSSVLSLRYGILEVHGLSFILSAFLFTPTLLLRDVLHEQGRQLQAFLVTISSFTLLYFVVDDERWVIAGAWAVIWTFLIDGAVYTWFRRFGWVPAVLISDLITNPITPLLFFWQYADGWSLPDGQLLLKYLTLLVFHVIVLTTPSFDRMMGDVPRFIHVPRKDWFKFYDRV